MSADPVKSGESGEAGKVVMPPKIERRKLTSVEYAPAFTSTPAKYSR